MRLTYKDSTVPHTNDKGELWEAYSDYNYNEIINKLATYEDAEEQERLVILPCKVGTRIYFNPPKNWAWFRNPPYEYEITNLIISCNKKNKWVKKYRAMQIINGKVIDSQINFEFYDIGKTVFFTREEAEAALKEGEKDA